MPPSLSEEIAAADRVIELERALATTQRALARAKHKTEDLVDAVYRGAKDASVIVGKPSPLPRPPADRRKAGDAEVALLHMTDWQVGKETTSYGSVLAAERVRRVVAKTIRLTEIQRADHPIKKCVLMLGGDLIEGTQIFAAQAWQVDSEAFAQVFLAASLVEQTVLTLLDRFDTVEVAEVAGNHGRLGRKGEGPRGDNWDRIIGRIARDRLGRQRRLTWMENETNWHAMVQIGNYKALLVHGDQVQGGGGQLPAYGIFKKAAAWASGVTEPFQDVYLGHYHSAFSVTLPNGGRVFMTPSIESGSEYAREFIAMKGKPGQRLHFIDPRHGRITSEHMIWCD